MFARNLAAPHPNAVAGTAAAGTISRTLPARSMQLRSSLFF
jgi:hypothetical protein